MTVVLVAFPRRPVEDHRLVLLLLVMGHWHWLHREGLAQRCHGGDRGLVLEQSLDGVALNLRLNLLMQKMMMMMMVVLVSLQLLVGELLRVDSNAVVARPVFRGLGHRLEHAALALHELLKSGTMLGLALLLRDFLPEVVALSGALCVFIGKGAGNGGADYFA